MQRYWNAIISALILVVAAGVGSAQTKPPQSSTANTPPAPSANAPSIADDPDDDDDSPDIPPMARGRVNEQEYLRLRAEQAAVKRGADDLARHPQARSQAIRTMEAQERALRQRQAAAAKAAGSAISVLSSTQWAPLGPDPIPNGQTITGAVAVSGRVTAIAIDPADVTANTVYVGTAQGGLYRTLDGGATWTALMDSAQSLAIGALTLDPNNHTTLFVGTGEGNFSLDSFFGVGLYIIQNANTTANLTGPFNAPTVSPNADGFTDVFTGRSITKILVNPGNSNQILVSTSSGFSGASGGTFSTLPTRGVYLSTNALGGSPTFTRLSIQPAADQNRPVTDMIMDPANANAVVVSVFGQTDTEGGVWISSTNPSPWSGTATWTQTLQAPQQANAKFAVSAATSPSTFLIGLGQSTTCVGKTVNGTLSKSTNGGGTWTELTAARGFCGGQCFYDIPVAINPNNASIIYIGGSAGSLIGSCGSGTLAKSTDGGTTFASSQGSLHADSHATAIFSGNPSIIYAGNDGGIFRSSDAGATWTSRNTTGFTATQFESIAVHPTDPNFTIGGTQDNGTPFLQPDGVTWTRADFGDGGFAAIDQNATDTTNVTMYHTYFNESPTLIGFAQVTSVADAQDAGWNFFGCGGTSNGINCSDTVLFYAPLALGAGNPNTVYFGTDRLYRSANQGVTMTVVSQAPIAANSPISAIGTSPLTDNVRIVGLGVDKATGSPSGRVFATSTGASTLTDVTGPWFAKYIARAVIDPNNPTTAYITLDGYGVSTGHVWKTTNLAAATPTWTSMSSGIPDVPVNGFAVDPLNSNNLYAGTDIGVYNSSDGGNTWNPFGTGLPRVAVFDLKVTAKRTVRIATHGRGMWELAAVSAGIATTLGTSAPFNPPGNGLTLTVVVNHTSGIAVPTGTVVFLDSGTVLGSASLDGSATATLPTGNLAPGSHTFFAAYGGDSTYAASQAPFPTTVIVQPPDFALSLTSGTSTVPAGQSGTYPISVLEFNGFTGTVTFSCTSGLPALTGCSFNPASVGPATPGGSTTLTINTTAPTSAPPATGLGAGLGTIVAGFLGLVLFGGLAARKRARRWRPAFLMLAVLVLVVAMISCGGGSSPPVVVHNPGTPPGTSVVTITATSGSITHTATVTLVVQ